MKFIKDFPLTIRTIAFIAITSGFVVLTTDLQLHYFNSIYYVPGLFFSSLVALTFKSPRPILWSISFVVISTILYCLIYIGSMMLTFYGICIVPSFGALFFIALMNTLLNLKISNKTVLISSLAGPIAGGITILLIFTIDNSFALIFFLPIPIWWIFMSVLLDCEKRKIENV